MATTHTDNPPLESGDRLTREEFHRRYEADPRVRKAELIEGVVYVASPSRFSLHDQQRHAIAMWAGNYALLVDGIHVSEESTVRLLSATEVQPDVLMFREVSTGGQVVISSEGYLEGPPELVVEIAGSSASYDLHDKLAIYERSGVREYIVWVTRDHRLEWYRSVGGKFASVPPDAQGFIESTTFPGLRLDVPAMLALDTKKVLAGIGVTL